MWQIPLSSVSSCRKTRNGTARASHCCTLHWALGGSSGILILCICCRKRRPRSSSSEVRSQLTAEETTTPTLNGASAWCSDKGDLREDATSWKKFFSTTASGSDVVLPMALSATHALPLLKASARKNQVARSVASWHVIRQGHVDFRCHFSRMRPLSDSSICLTMRMLVFAFGKGGNLLRLPQGCRIFQVSTG